MRTNGWHCAFANILCAAVNSHVHASQAVIASLGRKIKGSSFTKHESNGLTGELPRLLFSYLPSNNNLSWVKMIGYYNFARIKACFTLGLMLGMYTVVPINKLAIRKGFPHVTKRTCCWLSLVFEDLFIPWWISLSFHPPWTAKHKMSWRERLFQRTVLLPSFAIFPKKWAHQLFVSWLQMVNFCSEQ